MNTTVVTLLAGFAGSLITLIITKVIDYWQSKQQRDFDLKKDERDFDQELKKQFFARKLEVAEDFIKALTQLTIACQGGAQMYRSIQDGQALDQLASGKVLMEQSQKNFEASLKSLGEKGSIIDMYFKLDANPMQKTLSKSQSLPMEFERCCIDVGTLYADADKAQQNNDADAASKMETAKLKVNEMMNLASQLENMYYELSDSCTEMIRVLQTKMMKYDY